MTRITAVIVFCRNCASWIYMILCELCCVVFQSLYFQHQDNPSARQRKSSDGSSQHVSVYAVTGAGMCVCHPLTEALVHFELVFSIMITSNLTCDRKSQLMRIIMSLLAWRQKLCEYWREVCEQSVFSGQQPLDSLTDNWEPNDGVGTWFLPSWYHMYMKCLYLMNVLCLYCTFMVFFLKKSL